MSSPGWATVGNNASGNSFFTFSMSDYCARIQLLVFGYPSYCQQGENLPPFEFRRSSDETPFLLEEDIRPLLRLEDLIPAMERALTDFSAGHVIQPLRRIIPV